MSKLSGAAQPRPLQRLLALCLECLMELNAALRDTPVKRKHEEEFLGDVFMDQPFSILKSESLILAH